MHSMNLLDYLYQKYNSQYPMHPGNFFQVSIAHLIGSQPGPIIGLHRNPSYNHRKWQGEIHRPSNQFYLVHGIADDYFPKRQ